MPKRPKGAPVTGSFDALAPETVLSAVEQQLAGRPDRENRLRWKLDACSEDYDYCIVDCPPSVGLLTFNALVACGEALVVTNGEYGSGAALTSPRGIAALQDGDDDAVHEHDEGAGADDDHAGPEEELQRHEPLRGHSRGFLPVHHPQVPALCCERGFERGADRGRIGFRAQPHQDEVPLAGFTEDEGFAVVLPPLGQQGFHRPRIEGVRTGGIDIRRRSEEVVDRRRR